MERLIVDKFIKWKNSSNRKPILLKGARQVGKTFSCLEFGRNHYDNVVYFHFEGDESSLHPIFDIDLNPHRIIDDLASYSRQTIMEEKTLIIFDEIQACEKALTSLKYFCEFAPKYHIIATGSLLGLAINRGNFSFPVGKVHMMTMYPLSFEEFLLVTGNELLFKKIKSAFNSFEPLPRLYHEQALALYRKYLVVGGYPSVVNSYIKENDFNAIRAEQANIADSYISDLAKYATPNVTVRSIDIFNTLSSQLIKENTKFQYAVIKSNARAKDYELSLQWLKAANVVLENIKITEGKLPLPIYEQIESFKIYYSDVGLLSFKSGIVPKDIISSSNVSDKARGLLAENYVAEQLIARGHKLNYWESNGTAEIDFVLRLDDCAIPIEVKSADNVRARSLNSYIKKYKPDYAIRISAKNFGYENGIKSVPLYAVFCIE
ncbi:MAG: AAA family ATPase [Christensenellaceae bacterium]|jgi:predicted AAA+ superfamily ATPase|nr:AAA family ATPase [Christensenellaceae bacterium]